MDRTILGFTSSREQRPEMASYLAVVDLDLAAEGEYRSPDEMWEPPTPEEWRRALRAVVMSATRQIFGGGLCWRQASEVHPSVTWH
jgi:hypothetical protein